MRNRRLWVSIVAGAMALIMILGLLAGLIAPRGSALAPEDFSVYQEK